MLGPSLSVESCQSLHHYGTLSIHTTCLGVGSCNVKLQSWLQDLRWSKVREVAQQALAMRRHFAGTYLEVLFGIAKEPTNDRIMGPLLQLAHPQKVSSKMHFSVPPGALWSRGACLRGVEVSLRCIAAPAISHYTRSRLRLRFRVSALALGQSRRGLGFRV